MAVLEKKVYESQIIVMKNDKENKEECLSAVKKADYCVLVYRTYSNACLDPGTDDGFSSAVFDEIIALRHEEGTPVVVISCGLPYDAARFTDADAIVLAYNSSPMKEIPNESGAGSAYAPNLAAALVSCFGGVKATGTLPVSVPEIDGNYQITDKILYEGGK